jgi:ABC-type lipoprotein release transport system permease subunit
MKQILLILLIYAIILSLIGWVFGWICSIAILILWIIVGEIYSRRHPYGTKKGQLV